jgi:hypothetical protein
MHSDVSDSSEITEVRHSSVNQVVFRSRVQCNDPVFDG